LRLLARNAGYTAVFDPQAASAQPVPTLLESLQVSSGYKSHATVGKNKNVWFFEAWPPHQAGPIISCRRIFDISIGKTLSVWITTALCFSVTDRVAIRTNALNVMLSPSATLRVNSAKHLAFSSDYEVEILRLRLGMTLRHGPFAKGEIGVGF
jgi:hypothetical protein